MAADVERIALDYPDVSMVKASARQNPITGQHVELLVEPVSQRVIDKDSLLAFMRRKLPAHMVPKRIRVDSVQVGHRFKKM